MREVMGQLVIPGRHGCHRPHRRRRPLFGNSEELQWDLDNLKTQWDQDRGGLRNPRGALFLVFTVKAMP